MNNTPVSPAQLLRVADRLGKLEEGSVEADQAIHAALRLRGEPARYTRRGEEALRLMPVGFEVVPGAITGVRVYAACRRKAVRGGQPGPVHGQWAAAFPLALCGAVLRARAAMKVLM